MLSPRGTFVLMSTSSDDKGTSRRERKPLPECLTRLLPPQSTEPRRPAAISSSKMYMRVLAATWVQLDRLAQLADVMVDPVGEPTP
jgi:hypothetical protein